MTELRSPSTLILPDINAIIGLRFPLDIFAKSSASMVKVAAALSRMPLQTSSLPSLDAGIPLPAAVAGQVKLHFEVYTLGFARLETLGHRCKNRF